MNELIKVNYENADRPTVMGRELHEALKIETPYKKWFDRMCAYGFIENKDFLTVDKNVRRADGTEMPQVQYDHQLTLDMAKELCMIQRSDIGRKCREYFIEVEKKYRDGIGLQKPDSYMIADPIERAKRWIEEEQERQALVTKNVELEQKIKEDTPLVDFAVQVSQKSDTISMNEMAKIIHDENIPIGRNMLFRWLRNKGILMENNMPYQRYITDGYFKVKTAAKFTSYGVKHFPKTVVTGKGQIYIVQKLKAEYGMINKEED